MLQASAEKQEMHGQMQADSVRYLNDLNTVRISPFSFFSRADAAALL